MKYPFIAIPPRSTLTQNGSTWKGPIYGSNRTVLHLDCVRANNLGKIELLETELFDHLCVNKWLIFNWSFLDMTLNKLLTRFQ